MVAARNSNDFVPLFPWVSASLAGIGMARLAVAFGWIETLAKPKASATPALQLKFLGQHSLLFYIIHQPVLSGLVWLAAQIMPPTQNAVGAQFQEQCQAVCRQQFNEKQCNIYCACFEAELTDNAVQWSQLAAENKTEAISEVCSRKM